MELRILALACLVGAAFAGPVQRQQENRCSTTCENVQDPQMKYVPGKAYHYTYRSKNNLFVVGSSKGETTLEAEVELHFHSRCDGTLKIKNPKIQQKGPQEDKDDLKRNLELPVGYTYTNDNLTHVCSSSEESTESLNIKRAILSLLVNQVPVDEKSGKIEERDSFGKCSTEYTVHYENGERVIKKVKDLSSCSNDESFIEHLQKKIPLFSEKRLECEERIKDGIVKSKQCQETHKMRSPLENNKGIMDFKSTVEFRHTVTKSADKPSFEESYKKEEISYSTGKHRQGARNERAAKRIVEEMCSNPKHHIKNFKLLTSHVERCSYKALTEINEMVEDRNCDPRVRQIWIDALAHSLTDATLKVLIEKMASEDTGYKPISVCTRMAFLKEPTNETVDAILPYFETDRLPAPCGIATALLVRRYCEDPKPNRNQIKMCGIVAHKLVKKLESAISSNDERKILSTLRYAENAGVCRKPYTSSSAFSKIASDKSYSLRIRSAALDVNKQVNEETVHIATDPDEEIQIRSSAMKKVMYHGEEKHIEKMFIAAKSETNKQALFYFNSLVQNTNSTQSPILQRTKRYLQDKEWNTTLSASNYFFTSRNWERSAYVKALNAGASFDADICLSEQPIEVPVKMGSSLNVYMFNETWNLFEVDFKAENVRPMVQRLLEAKETLPKYEDILTRLEQKPSFEEIKEGLKHIYSQNIIGDPKPEVSMRFKSMGVNLVDVSTSDLSGMREMGKIAEIMSKLSHEKKIEYSHSAVVMNSKLTLTSVTGRPYDIEVVGSSTVGISAKTKADFMKLPRNADMHLNIEPRAAFEFTISASVPSGSEKPDVKFATSMHAESHAKAGLKLEKGSYMKFEYTPSPTIASIEINSTVIETDHKQDEVSAFEKLHRKIDWRWNALKAPLGIGSHVTVDVPKPLISNKPPYILPIVNAKASIEAIDVKYYQLIISKSQQGYKVLADTPGSKTNRKQQLTVEVKPDETLLRIDTPFGNVTGKVLHAKRDNLLNTSVELYTGERQLISGSWTVDHKTSRTNERCEMLASVAFWGEKPKTVRFVGERKRTERKDVIELKAESNMAEPKPVAFKLIFVKEGKNEVKVSGAVEVKTPKADFKASGTMEQKPQSVTANLAIGCKPAGRQEHNINFLLRHQEKPNKRNLQVKITSNIDIVPNYDIKVDSQKQSKDRFLNRIIMSREDIQLAEIKQISHMPETGPGHCFVSAKVPSLEINRQINVTHKIEPRNINMWLQYINEQDEHTSAEFQADFRNPLKAEVNAKLDNKGEIVIYKGRINKSDNVWTTKSEVFHRENKKFELKIKVSNKSSHSKYHHEFESHMRLFPSARNHPQELDFNGLFQWDGERIILEAREGSGNKLHANLGQDGSSIIELKLGDTEFTIKLIEGHKKKTLDANLKTGSNQSTLLLTLEHGETKKLKIEVIPNTEDPDNKILLAFVLKRFSDEPVDRYDVSLKIIVPGYIEVHVNEKGRLSLMGDSELSAEVSHKKFGQSAMKIRLENDDDQRVTLIFELHNDQNKLVHLKVVGKQNETDSNIEAIFIAPGKHLKHPLEIRANFNKKENPSEPSTTVQTALSCKNNGKDFKLGFHFTMHPEGLKLKSEITDEKSGKNTVDAAVQASDKAITSYVRFEGARNKKLHLQTDIKTDDKSLKIVSNLDSSFSKSGQMQVTLNNDHKNKSIEAFISVDNKPCVEIKGIWKHRSLQGKIKISDSEAELKVHSSSTSTSLSTSVQLKDSSWVSHYKMENGVRSSVSFDTKFRTPKSEGSLLVKREPSRFEGSLSYNEDKTPKISAKVTYEKNNGSLSLSADVVKGKSPLLSTSLNRLSYPGGEKLLMKANRFEENLLYVEISDEASAKNSNQGQLKAKVQVQGYSFSSSIYRNDENSYRCDVQMCQESKGTCHTLKARNENSKKEPSSQNVQVYSNQKLTIVYEKSNQGSSPKQIGILQASFYLTDNDLESICVMKDSVKNSKLGYELVTHVRENVNDQCRFLLQMYLPNSTHAITGSMEHQPNGIKIVANAKLDTKDSRNKKEIGMELVKKTDPDNKEASGYLTINLPNSPRPTHFKWHLKQQEDEDSVVALFQFQHADHEYKFKVVPYTEQGVRSLNVSLTNGKGEYGSLKLFRHEYTNAFTVGYESNCFYDGHERNASVKITSFRKFALKGLKLEISYPSADYEVEGTVQSTGEINLRIASAGKKQYEISMRPHGQCRLVDLEKQGKVIATGDFCAPNWRETSNGIEWQWLKFKVLNTLNKDKERPVIIFEINSEGPIINSHVDLIYKYHEKELRHLLKSLHVDELNEKVQNLLQKVRSLIDDVIERYSRELRRCREQLKSLYDPYEPMIKHCLRKYQEVKKNILKSIKAKIPYSVKELCNKSYQHLQRVCEHLSWSKLSETYSKCLENMKSVVRQVNVRNVKMHLRRIFERCKQSLIKNAPTMQTLESYLPGIMFRFFRDTILPYIKNTIAPFVERSLIALETFIREKGIELIETIIKAIHGIISNDEDLQTAQELIVNAKNEIVKTWNNREQIAQDSVRYLEQSSKENLRKLSDKFVQVLQHDPKSGEYGYRVQPHFSLDDFKNLKQNFLDLRRKVQAMCVFC